MNNEMTTDNMSNEEIVDILKGIVFNGFDRTTPKERQALVFAFKALEARPHNPTEDLISRSDALKAVDNRHEELLHHPEYLRKHCQIDLLGIKKHILAIPPANVLKPTEGDLISREALREHKFVGIEFVQLGGRTNGKTLENINRAYQKGWNDCIDAIIDNAPTVEPTTELCKGCRFLKDCETCDGYLRPQGEWIKDVEGDTICSNCGFECLLNEDGLFSLGRYCHHCGAYMEAN